MSKEKKIPFQEDGVKKKCINRWNAKNEQWLTRMSAGVETHSFHLVSSSQGCLTLHRDLLNEKGKKTGVDFKPTVVKVSELNLADRDLTCSSSNKFVLFPLTPNIEINTIAASSQQVKSSEGKGKLLMVEYK